MIIGLGHRRNTGKDTLGFILRQKLQAEGWNAKKIAFADPLYAICVHLYGHMGFKNKCYYDEHRDEKEETLPIINKSPRQILIEVGNKIRDVYPETWVQLAIATNIVTSELVASDVTIITDVRYRNEYEAILDAGGMLVKVERDVEQFDDIADSALCDAKWHWTIKNNGSIADLQDAACDLLLSLSYSEAGICAINLPSIADDLYFG